METELEQLRAENERLKLRQEKILRLFATHIPFEIRTPLSSIRGYSELIQQDSHNLTAQQLDYFSHIQLANNRMFEIAEFATDYARYGFTKPDNLNPIKLANFEKSILKPLEKHFSDFEIKSFKVFEKWSTNTNSFGILIDELAIQRALDRIFRELFCYYAIDQIQVSLSGADGKFFIQITAPHQLRAEPLFRSIYQNHYDQGHIDWAVEAIIELYDGELQFGVVDGMIEIEIRLPIVKL